jgi:hypothetical protein
MSPPCLQELTLVAGYRSTMMEVAKDLAFPPSNLHLTQVMSGSLRSIYCTF